MSSPKKQRRFLKTQSETSFFRMSCKVLLMLPHEGSYRRHLLRSANVFSGVNENNTRFRVLCKDYVFHETNGLCRDPVWSL
eukprot:UN21816